MTHTILSGDDIQGNHPEWGPLALVAPDMMDDFMWMYEVVLEDGVRVHAYKTRTTRRYLHLDRYGRSYSYLPDGRYRRTEAPSLTDAERAARAA